MRVGWHRHRGGDWGLGRSRDFGWLRDFGRSRDFYWSGGLEPEWMRTSGPGAAALGMNSSPGRNRPIGSSGRRRARNTVVSTWQWCYSSDWAVSHQLDNTDARSVILAGTAGCGGQDTYFSSHQLLRNRQVVLSLQVQPKLGVHAKPMPEPESAVTGHRTFARQNLADSVGWHVNLTCEARRRYSPSSSSSFRISPGCTTRFNMAAVAPSVIVHNLNVGWSCLPRGPTEADAPLRIDLLWRTAGHDLPLVFPADCYAEPQCIQRPSLFCCLECGEGF